MKEYTFNFYFNTWFICVECYDLNYEKKFNGYSINEIKKIIRNDLNLKYKRGIKFKQIYPIYREL